MAIKQSSFNRYMTVLRYGILIVATFVSLFPFVWMLIAATNNTVAINAGSMTFGDQLMVNLGNLFNPVSTLR